MEMCSSTNKSIAFNGGIKVLDVYGVDEGKIAFFRGQDNHDKEEPGVLPFVRYGGRYRT
jgi:hypothetical protein